MSRPESLYIGMPSDLVFVRHGLSEANIIQFAEKTGSEHPKHKDIFKRPDWKQRLSPEGEEHARQAGELLVKEFGGSVDEVFDRKYTSTFIRSRETAVHLGGLSCSGWVVDDRLVERSWGSYGAMPKSLREQTFPHTKRLSRTDRLYAGFDGGEALASGVYLRFRDFLDTLHREASGQKVLVVSHGELIQVARYILERMLPEQFDEMDKDKTQKIRNCSVLHYTRINPEDPNDIRKRLSWMRMLYPNRLDQSPFDGKWQEIGNGKTKNGSELMAQVSSVPRLL